MPNGGHGGHYYQHHHRSNNRNWLRTVITILAVVFSVWGAWGLLFLVSPSLFVKSVAWLPEDFQNSMAGDYLISGGMNLYIIPAVAVGLWWLRSRMRKY